MAKKKLEPGKLVVGIPLMGVPIKWHVPDNIITRFVTNIVIQTIEKEFKISFFEINPEIFFDPSNPPKEIQAECVSRVVITADRLQSFIDILQAQLNLYNSNQPIKRL